MKTLHVLILAAAILGAAWILKPAPVEQVSQAELQRREEATRWLQQAADKQKAEQCAGTIGKTLATLNRDDPAQEAPYRRCMWPEESRSRIRLLWDKISGTW